jgi:hypothetical protein
MRYTDRIETLLERIALIMQVQARKDFLLLKMTPAEVQKQLHAEFADTYEKSAMNTPSAAYHIVSKPF